MRCTVWDHEQRHHLQKYSRWIDSATDRSRSIRYHPLFNTWRMMIRRCYDDTSDKFEEYGGRGIGVHDAWRHDPVVFIDHVEQLDGCYGSDRTVDRTDNESGYLPGNLAWRTPTEQNNNRRERQTLNEIPGPCKLCDFACSDAPGICEHDGPGWAAAVQLVREYIDRRNEQHMAELCRPSTQPTEHLPSLVEHRHTGGYVDCLACVLDPVDLSDGLLVVLYDSPQAYCADRKGETRTGRRGVPISLVRAAS